MASWWQESGSRVFLPLLATIGVIGTSFGLNWLVDFRESHEQAQSRLAVLEEQVKANSRIAAAVETLGSRMAQAETRDVTLMQEVSLLRVDVARLSEMGVDVKHLRAAIDRLEQKVK